MKTVGCVVLITLICAGLVVNANAGIRPGKVSAVRASNTKTHRNAVVIGRVGVKRNIQDSLVDYGVAVRARVSWGFHALFSRKMLPGAITRVQYDGNRVRAEEVLNRYPIAKYHLTEAVTHAVQNASQLVLDDAEAALLLKQLGNGEVVKLEAPNLEVRVDIRPPDFDDGGSMLLRFIGAIQGFTREPMYEVKIKRTIPTATVVHARQTRRLGLRSIANELSGE